MEVEYDSNNSGGRWWLKDEDWYALEKAGWTVEWMKNRPASKFFELDKDGRWLGTLAKTAKKQGVTLHEAIAEWERVTHQDSSALGCNCCGPPHSFTAIGDDGKSTDYYSPEPAVYGTRYDDPCL